LPHAFTVHTTYPTSFVLTPCILTVYSSARLGYNFILITYIIPAIDHTSLSFDEAHGQHFRQTCLWKFCVDRASSLHLFRISVTTCLVVGLLLRKVLLKEAKVFLSTTRVLLSRSGFCNFCGLSSIVRRELRGEISGDCRGFGRGREGVLLHDSDMCVLGNRRRLVGFEFTEIELLDDILASDGGRGERTDASSAAGNVRCLPEEWRHGSAKVNV